LCEKGRGVADSLEREGSRNSEKEKGRNAKDAYGPQREERVNSPISWRGKGDSNGHVLQHQKKRPAPINLKKRNDRSHRSVFHIGVRTGLLKGGG